MKIKLHFNRVNMQRKDERVWSAHTSRSCNMAKEIEIRHNGLLIGKAVFNPEKKDNPRAWIEFHGNVKTVNEVTMIECVTINSEVKSNVTTDLSEDQQDREFDFLSQRAYASLRSDWYQEDEEG